MSQKNKVKKADKAANQERLSMLSVQVREPENVHTQEENEVIENLPETEKIIDFTDVEEVKRAFIAGEVFNRKY